MKEKKNNLFLLVPSFLLIGTAISLQTGSFLRDSITGIIVGFAIFMVLSYRNNNIDKTDS